MTKLRLLLPAILLLACAEEQSSAPVYESAAVERHSISVSVGSSGVVEPLARVEVKSKASGEVLELLVATGDYVEQGALMVNIDPRTVANRLAQAEAELKAALSRRQISISQMERAERLVKQGTFTEADYEQAALELANAEALVVTAEVTVENARIAVDDTDIRAPVSGTVIAKPVEKGQVISSPTQDVGGGTLLLTMADLSAVQIRALVDETDIGKIRPGMQAEVTVAAYPNQPFPGEVIKIEPQAVVEQNVTMFAVLISIRNPEGLLMPGMNAEVEVSVARRDNVLAVPVMALRTERDVAATAGILGISESDLREQLADGGGKAVEVPAVSSGSTISIGGRTIQLPEGIDADQVRSAMQKRRSGDQLSTEEQQLMRRVFSGQDGPRGGRDRGRGKDTDYRFGGDFWVVIEEQDGTTRVANVKAGLTDLDRVEIVSGLEENDRVFILPSAHLVETQEQLQNWINRRVGTVPGIGSN
jgi:HlyD family secretion protein